MAEQWSREEALYLSRPIFHMIDENCGLCSDPHGVPTTTLPILLAAHHHAHHHALMAYHTRRPQSFNTEISTIAIKSKIISQALYPPTTIPFEGKKRGKKGGYSIKELLFEILHYRLHTWTKPQVYAGSRRYLKVARWFKYLLGGQNTSKVTRAERERHEPSEIAEDTPAYFIR